MAILSDYTSGTVSASAGGTVVTGSGTAWLTAGFGEGDIFIAPGWSAIVKSVDSNTQVTLYPTGIRGAALTGSTYRMRYMSDGARVSGQTRQLIDLLSGTGSIEALAGVTGQPDKIPMFTGPGTMTLIDRQDLTQGIEYDAFVDNIAARAAYDNEAAGFAVVVADTGDGRSAVYTRVGAAGNWSAPAYITGPAVTLDVTEVDEVPYGTPPDVTVTPIGGGYNLKFEIPRGMMIQPGTVTTVGPDTPASVDFVPITGGYQINFSIPRGPTGDITGVTPFWVTRLGADTTATQARAGLRAAEIDVTEIAGIEPTLDLIFSSPDAIDPAWFTRASVGTYFDARGMLRLAAENEPRIEYDPVTGELLGLLIEEQRTNLLLQSEDLSNAAWGKARTSVVAADAYGDVNAWKVIATSVSGNHQLTETVPATAAVGSKLQFQFMMKGDGSAAYNLRLRVAGDGTFLGDILVDPDTGTRVSAGTPDEIIPLQNGWFLVKWSWEVATAITSNVGYGFWIYSKANGAEFAGDDTGGVIIAAPQVEVADCPTSYIPTTESAATRQTDVCAIPNDNWWLENQWSSYFEANWQRRSVTGRNITIGPNYFVTSNNRIRVMSGGGTALNEIRLNARVEGNTTTRTSPGVIVPDAMAKFAVSLNEGEAAKLCVNGGTIGNLNQAGVVRGPAVIYLGQWNTPTDVQNGHIRRVTYFPRRMTNAQLQAITAQ